MRILYHHRTQAEDAQGIHIYEIVKAFRDLGHEVEIVALVELGDSGEKKIRGGLWKWVNQWVPNWLYEIMGLVYNLYGYWNLCRAIRSKHPDLIYERYALNTFCGIWASRRFGIPLILEVNAPLYHEQSKLGKLTFKHLARFSERWICSHSTWTVVVSKIMKEILIQGGVPHEKMIVMPNGIDPQKFHPDISGEPVRQKYSLEGKVVIGFVGWFRKWHGLEILLEIMNESHLVEQGARLLLVGDGPAYSDLHNYVEKHDLKSAVTFTGPVRSQDIPHYIAAMDIAVQPSATEYASPIKIFEYMAMGKCIVAPGQPNILEVLEDRTTGLLFQAGDKESLRAVLQELLNNPTKRATMGRKASEHIFKRGFLWHANAQRVLGLISEKELYNASDRSVDKIQTGKAASESASQRKI